MLIAHVQNLPPSWGTLYELSKVPNEVLEAKLAAGEITPKLERKDVKGLLAPRVTTSTEGSNKPAPVDSVEASAEKMKTTFAAAETVDSTKLNAIGKPYGESFDPNYKVRHNPPTIGRLCKPFSPKLKAALLEKREKAALLESGKGETKPPEDFALEAETETTPKVETKPATGKIAPQSDKRQRAQALIAGLAEVEIMTLAVDLLLGGDPRYEQARNNIEIAYTRLLANGKKH